MTTPKRTKLEELKEASDSLRGTIAASLASDSTHFSGDEGQLLKHHGTYQQDDRDLRQDLLKQKKERAYSMMVRTKAPGGYLTADQYLVHDDLARRFGNHTLRVTTRQGFQFHGVLKNNLKAVIRGINDCLATTLGACGDNVRNVMASPDILPEGARLEIFRRAKEISDEFLARGGAYHEIWLDGEKASHLPEPRADHSEPLYGKTYLPRKFKIAITLGEDNHVDVYSQDLGIVPELNRDGNLEGFNILVGGGFGMTHGIATTYPRLATPFCFVSPDDLVAICRAVILTQRDHGNRCDRKRARLKYLLDEKGLDWFRGEVEHRFGKKTEPCREIRLNHMDNYLGWRRQADGRWFYGLFIENGRLKDSSGCRLLTAVRELVTRFRTDLYLTAQQDILFCGLQQSDKAEFESILKRYDVKLSEEIHAARRDAMACPALPTCGLAISESERALPSVLDQLQSVLDRLGLSNRKFMIRMTGCPNGCARPYNGEIAFVGRTAGTYSIYLGGSLRGDRLNEVFAEKISQEQLIPVLEPVLTLYAREGEKGEGFGDYCSRLGMERLKALTAHPL